MRQICQKKSAAHEYDIEDFASRIIDNGGEGCVILDGSKFYKVKPSYDAEAVVIGYTEGTGNRAGMTGALIVREGVNEFKIGSGLTHKDCINPPAIGSNITFKFSGRTSRNLPRHPVFLRVRPDGV